MKTRRRERREARRREEKTEKAEDQKSTKKGMSVWKNIYVMINSQSYDIILLSMSSVAIVPAGNKGGNRIS